jgi:crotonobetainyl-CoA:carnitine CoA-transferase CaiB-like acyl-CoA transferase
MTAICHRDVHQVGQHVDASLQEAATLMIAPELTRVAYANKSPGMRLGLLPCKDGYVSLNVRTDQSWRELWAFLGEPKVADDPRFLTVADRRARQRELEDVLRPHLTRFTMEELFHGLQPRRILVGMTLDTAHLVQNRHLQERGFFVTAEHPVAGSLTYVGAPFKMGQTPWQLRYPAPLLGQHNTAIYMDQLGHTPQALEEWKMKGIV